MNLITRPILGSSVPEQAWLVRPTSRDLAIRCLTAEAVQTIYSEIDTLLLYPFLLPLALPPCVLVCGTLCECVYSPIHSLCKPRD